MRWVTLAIPVLILAGCSLLEPAFQHTLQGVRDLPPDAPTPGWQDLTGQFVTAVLTILGGTVGGSALYGGVIRPRRRAREESIRVRDLVKARLDRGGVKDET
jgi:hypothetical protein